MPAPRKPHRKPARKPTKSAKPRKPSKHNKPRRQPWGSMGWRRVGSGGSWRPRSNRMQWLAIIVPSVTAVVVTLLSVWL